MKMKITSVLEVKYFFYAVSIIYRLCLDFSYVNFISPIFGYSGFHTNFDATNYLISWLVTITLLFFTPNNLNRISDYFLVIFSFILLIPMLCLFGFNDEFQFYPIAINLCAYLAIYFSLKVSFFNTKIRYPYVKNGENSFKVICFIMIFYLVFWYVVSGAVSNFNLDVSKVYEFRDENAAITNVGPLAYLNSWVLKVFNLALIAYTLLRKKYIAFTFLLLIQVFFYGVSAHKSVLFAPVIIFGIYFYLSRTKSLATIPLGLSVLTIICMSIYIYNDDITLSSLFIRRVLFVPNYLTFTYFDFFSTHPFAYWTNTFSFIGTPVYPDGIPSTVGSYLGSDELRANNGFISSGFAQAGILGVFIYVLLMILILKLIDQISEDIGFLWFTLCIVITPLRVILVSSDLLTVILTHGLLVAILLLFLLRKPRLNL